MPTIEEQIQQDRAWDLAHQDDAIAAIRRRDEQIATQIANEQSNASSRAEAEHRKELDKRSNLLNDLFHVPETTSPDAPKQQNFLKDLMGAVSPIFQFFIQIFGNVEKIQKAMRPDGAPLRDGDIADDAGRLYQKALKELQEAKDVTTPSLNDAWVKAGSDPKKQQKAYDQLIQRLISEGEEGIANRVMKERSKQLAGHFTKAMSLQGPERVAELQQVADKLGMSNTQAKKMCRAIEHFHNLESLSLNGGKVYAKEQAELYHRLRLLEQSSDDYSKIHSITEEARLAAQQVGTLQLQLDLAQRDPNHAQPAEVERRRGIAVKLQQARERNLKAISIIQELGGDGEAQRLKASLRGIRDERVNSLESFTTNVQLSASQKVQRDRQQRLASLQQETARCAQVLTSLGVNVNQPLPAQLDDQRKVEAGEAYQKSTQEVQRFARAEQAHADEITTFITTGPNERANFLDQAQAHITAGHPRGNLQPVNWDGNGVEQGVNHPELRRVAMDSINRRQSFLSSIDTEELIGDSPETNRRLSLLREM